MSMSWQTRKNLNGYKCGSLVVSKTAGFGLLRHVAEDPIILRCQQQVSLAGTLTVYFLFSFFYRGLLNLFERNLHFFFGNDLIKIIFLSNKF